MPFLHTPVEVYGAALSCGQAPLRLVFEDGSTRVLPVASWTAAETAGDASMTSRCTGPTLDVGCGPGRLTVALAAAGVAALGVDIAPGATRLAAAGGALVLERSVFDRLPGTGRWHHALLADGNVGIGGNPVRLLDRLAELLRPAGTVLVELEPPGGRSGAVRVRIEHAGRVSAWFRWAYVGPGDLELLGRGSGWRVRDRWCAGGRWFADLDRRAA